MRETSTHIPLAKESPLLGPFDAKIVYTGHFSMIQLIMSFEDVKAEGDKEKVTKHAYANPGRMYVNGQDNLMKFCKNHLITRDFIDSITWKIWIRELVEPKFKSLDLSQDLQKKTEVKISNAKRGGKIKEKGVICTHHVVMMTAATAFDTIDSIEIGLNKGQEFKKENANFSKFWDAFLDNILKPEAKAVDGWEKNWFVVSEVGFSGYSPSNVPEETFTSGKGRIQDIVRPYGGTIVTSDGLALFHRTNVYLNGQIVGFTDNFNLKPGTTVECDLVENEKEDGTKYVENFEGKYIAVSVYVGKRPAVPMDQEKATVIDAESLHKVLVTELHEDPQGSGIYNSGIGVIQLSTMIRNKKASESMIGEFVKFENTNLHYGGVSMAGKDLSYLVRTGEVLEATLTMLTVKSKKAQYEVKEGFLGVSEVCRLVLPESNVNLKRLERGDLDFETMENILYKNVPPKLNTLDENIAQGRIVALEPPENQKTTSKGTILIEYGKYKGKKVKLNRSKMSVFGSSLEEADLLYCVNPQVVETVYVDTKGIEDYAEGEFVTQSIRMATPIKFEPGTDPMTLERADKANFITWLKNHQLTLKDFQEVIAAKSSFRYFVPLPKYTHNMFLQGRITGLDRIHNPKAGCTCGTIVTDIGYFNPETPTKDGKGTIAMKGMKVTFHRTNLWVFGRKCAKADLSYLIQPNQRVNFEVEEITSDDRSRMHDLDPNIKFRATIAWIGPVRPRNDPEDPNKNDVSVFVWVQKRGMDIKKYNALLDGKVPAHSQMDLDMNNFFLAPLKDYANPGAEKEAMQERMGGMGGPGMPGPGGEHLPPVLRHGPVVAHMLETCISAQGPMDPRLMNLIENDEMAQAAFHISEALKFSLTHYREKTNRPMSGGMGMGMGFGGMKRPMGGGGGFTGGNGAGFTGGFGGGRGGFGGGNKRGRRF
eukprot:TRINITY_DN5832_c0_g1_i10.p1 TRINITY_DN5832_c0_g1~~TRINITY_DN5832_c0_g1_i10.p1  ORF type:complete len:933 (-),score=328.00 TRINITY_DN5832_c0_g1_i10:867-3665(-)